MNDRNIENTLKDLQAPAPEPMARLRAKRAALAEFERANATNNQIELAASVAADQENDNVVRLSRESTSGSSSMKRVANRGWYAIAAGVGVVAIGLTWVLPNLGRYERELEGPNLAAVPLPPETGGQQTTELPASASAPEKRADDAPAIIFVAMRQTIAPR